MTLFAIAMASTAWGEGEGLIGLRLIGEEATRKKLNIARKAFVVHVVNATQLQATRALGHVPRDHIFRVEVTVDEFRRMRSAWLRYGHGLRLRGRLNELGSNE